MAENGNVSSSDPKLIFACSGAADVGQISDMAARKMTKEGTGKMFCTAGLGGRVEPIMKMTSSASKILAIDGCSLDCVRHSLKEAGFEEFEHLQLGEIGLEKGSSDVTEENVAKVAARGKELLN
jgi:uncharacterized metal-binding protein